MAIKMCPLFAGLNNGDLAALLKISRRSEVPKGTILFSEGEDARGFYVPVSGKVKIYKVTPEGRERVLRIAEPGRTFAESSIFDLGIYPANAATLERSILLFFPKQDVLHLLKSNVHLAINMIGGISRLLREFMNQMEDIAFRDVPSRLARYLLDLAETSGSRVELPLSKTQLAVNLGTVSETLSRTFRKMVDDKLIRVQSRTIDILNIEGLVSLADRYKE
ncbi:MAG: Crp/Fnr family transcriptional regulator [Desulfuromonadaceae bacterium]|nr:Crp/Fnr family transcriptional regulator [Desulfuromonadaceae bacterium]